MSENAKIKVKKSNRSRSELTLLYEMVEADPQQVQFALAINDLFVCEIVHRNPERAKDFLRRLGTSVRAEA